MITTERRDRTLAVGWVAVRSSRLRDLTRSFSRSIHETTPYAVNLKLYGTQGENLT